MLNLTDNAQAAVSRFIRGSEEPATGLRISVTGGGCSGMQYGMALEAGPKASDVVLEFGEVKVFVDRMSAQLLAGTTVDFLDGVDGSGFKIDNPNATSTCGCGKSFSA
jgi:iron-sulfur cluster assembly accessory protein